MAQSHEVVLRKLQEHSSLSAADVAAIRAVPHTDRRFGANEDIVRQGDKPNVSVVVMEGMVGRYHTLPTGRRQYISFHISGDLPDVQSLFIEKMDHAVCAIDDTAVSLWPHAALIALFKERSNVAFAIWRETLIDAAIFREAITNVGGRPLQTGLAHLLCEQYYRARAGGLAKPGSCRLPLTQTQIGEALGASLPSVSRALRALRRSRSMDLRGGLLLVHDWDRLAALGDFHSDYLNLRKPWRL